MYLLQYLYREFNATQTDMMLKVNDAILEAIIKLADQQYSTASDESDVLETANEGLKCLLNWPSGEL